MNTDHSDVRAKVHASRDALFAGVNSFEAQLRALFHKVWGGAPKSLGAGSADSPVCSAPRPEHSQGWNRFSRMLRRVREHPKYQNASDLTAPYGYLAARPIIGEFSAVQGGVYCSALPAEAVVVDESHGALLQVYRQLLALIEERAHHSEVDEAEVVMVVFAVVDSLLAFNPSRVQALVTREEIGPDMKTSLDIFIHEGVGVARHQVLLASYCLEKLRAQGIIGGLATIDSIALHPEGLDERLVYTTSDGATLDFSPLELN